MKFLSSNHIGTKLLYFILFLAAGGVIGSCTRPNGDIGPLFGTWAFDEITVDGEPLPDYTEGIMISFQGTMFKIERLQNFIQIYGAWVKDGNEMTLDSKEEYKAGSFPPELGFDKNGVYTITIVSETGKRMEWRWVADDGKVWYYKLRKLL